jgi:N-acetyl-gamma-glutamyl-phosphate reductase
MKIFVDGQVGTTGLKIHERLEGRPDLTILRIDQEKRKDIHARKEMINEADIVFLCLPDTAAKEAVKLLDNPRTKIIDASITGLTDCPNLVQASVKQSGIRALSASRAAMQQDLHLRFIRLLFPGLSEEIIPLLAFP